VDTISTEKRVAPKYKRVNNEKYLQTELPKHVMRVKHLRLYSLLSGKLLLYFLSNISAK